MHERMWPVGAEQVYSAVLMRNYWHLMKYFSFSHCSPAPLLVKFISDSRTLLGARAIASALCKAGRYASVRPNYQVWYFVTAVEWVWSVHIQTPAEWPWLWRGHTYPQKMALRPRLLMVWSKLKSLSRRLGQWVQLLENETYPITY